MKKIIETENAPKPIGPYSQGIIAEGRLVFISGQIPLKPDGTLAGNDIRSQTRQAILNIKSILESAGASLEDVVKTTVLLSDLENFASMNEVYNEFFAKSKPARATYQVVRLPNDVLVEIEAIAVI